MADIRISQLPVAPAPIDGTELVPVVQNGLTVQTTVAAITQSPSLTATFLTVNQQPLLPNSRALSAGVGIGITDGGAQSTYNLSLNGTSGSLEGASTGVIVKSAPNTISARTLTASGNGISVTDGDGVSGNPTFQLTGLAAAIANMSGTGLIGLNSTTLSPLTLIGVANEISIADGNGAGGNPTIGIADNAVFPGVAGVTLPNGTTGQRGSTLGQIRYNTTSSRFEGNYGTGWQNFGTGDGAIASVAGTTNQIVVSTVGGAATVSIDPDPVIPGVGAIQIPAGTTIERPGGVNGQLRYNSTTALFEGYANGVWGSIATGGGVISVGTGVGLLGGPITSTGTIDIDTTVVATVSGTQTLTNKTINGANNTLSSIGNASLTNSSVTYNGVNVALGASGTITAVNPNALTIGTGLNGTSYNGSAAVTVAIANTGAAASTYGNSARTVTQAVNAQGQITSIFDQPIDGIALTTGSISAVASTGNSLVNKTYVDTLVASGIHFHQPVRVESPINLNATYNNGAAGVGATLTNAGTQVALVIDGVTVATNDRVLIYTQTNQTENGIYVVTDTGSGSTNWVLTRSSDADTYVINSANGLSEGSTVFVQQGATGAGESYTCNTSGVIVFGTTAITFAQISSAQIYSAGTGLTLTGTQFSLTAPVTAALGGTGQTSYATGDMLFASGATALSKLGIGANGYLLTVSAGIPSWQPAPATGVTSFSAGTTGLTPSTTTTGAVTLAGTLGVANGGTGVTTSTGSGNVVLSTSPTLVTPVLGTPTSVTLTNGTGLPLTTGVTGTLPISNGGTNGTAAPTAGTVAYGTGTAYAFTSAGTSGQVLQSNGSGAPTWVTPAGGVTLANDISTATDLYPTFANATTGSVSTIYTGNAKLLYRPSTGELKSTTLVATNGIVVNSATVNEDYTIPTGSNAISAGPVTVASGVTVTVSSGSVWAIV